MTPQDVTRKIDDIRDLIALRLGLKGGSLAQQVRRAGRLLPRWARREAAVMVHAEALAQHPKLIRQIDGPAFVRAHRNLSAWLATVSARERRIQRILSVLGMIAFNLIVLFIAVVTLLVWRGYV